MQGGAFKPPASTSQQSSVGKLRGCEASEPACGIKGKQGKAAAAASTQASSDQEASSAGPDPLHHQDLNASSAAIGVRPKRGRARAGGAQLQSRGGQVLAAAQQRKR